VKIAPKNWAAFQHYKTRRPPWIRLYRTLLDDYEFSCLPVASKALAPCLWLLASEYESGVITDSQEQIAFRLRMSVKDFNLAVKPLIDKGFFIDCLQDASNVLATCLRDACPETETETETDPFSSLRSEKGARKRAVDCPGDVDQKVWESFLQLRKAKRAPLSEVAVAGIGREAAKAGVTLQQALEIACTRGWTSFKADWVLEKKTRKEKEDDAWSLITGKRSANIIEVNSNERVSLGKPDF
jgi:hypothetical protein